MMTLIIQFFENLPLARLENLNIPLISVFLLFILIIALTHFLERKKASALIASLSVIALLILVPIPDKLRERENELWVLNKSETSEIRWNIGKAENKFSPDSVNTHKLVVIGNSKLLSISSLSKWQDMHTEEKLILDYLHLCGDERWSLPYLDEIFSFKYVILDATIPSRSVKRLIKECEKMNVKYHNIRENGALRISVILSEPA